jgi:hypothetical protein
MHVPLCFVTTAIVQYTYYILYYVNDQRIWKDGLLTMESIISYNMCVKKEIL